MNKRGMSAVIITLLLVMLAIIIAGIVYFVVNNIIKSGSQQVSFQSQCLSSGIEVSSFSCTFSGSECNVTVKRTSGSDQIGGVRLIFTDNLSNSNVSNSKGNFATFATKRVTVNNIGISNIIKVSAAIYFPDSSGKPEACPVVSTGLVGSVTSSGTSGGGGSSSGGGGSGSGGGGGSGTVQCSSDNDCGQNQYCDLNTNTCKDNPSCTSPSATEFCTVTNTYQCGTPIDSCGRQVNCSSVSGGCPSTQFCNSSYVCQTPKLLNSGTVDTAWPAGAPRFFNSADLPHNQLDDQALANGASYQGENSYVSFPDNINSPNCTEISFIYYQSSVDTSYASLNPVGSDSVNITAGKRYRIWDTKLGCVTDTI